MRMISRRAEGVAAAAGFSLLEAVVAAGILMLTVTVVTATVTMTSRAGQRSEATARADAAVASVIARLSALSYCAPTLPAPAVTIGPEAGDLLAAVFPHAVAGRDRSFARYVAADESGIEAGSFVTSFAEDGVAVVCVARFRTSTGGAWMGPSAIEGWDVTTRAAPPAPVLVVRVAASAGAVTRTGCLVRVAAAQPVLAGATPSTVTP